MDVLRALIACAVAAAASPSGEAAGQSPPAEHPATSGSQPALGDGVRALMTCALYYDDAFLAAVVHVQSSGNPYFVGDAVTLSTFDSLATVADAHRAARNVTAKGGRALVGLMGVPFAWASTFGIGDEALFDACRNVQIGTSVLGDAERICRRKQDRSTKARATRRGSAPAREATARHVLRLCVARRFAARVGLQAAPFAAAVAQELARQSSEAPSGLSPFDHHVSASSQILAPGVLGESADDGAPARPLPESPPVGVGRRVAPISRASSAPTLSDRASAASPPLRPSAPRSSAAKEAP